MFIKYDELELLELFGCEPSSLTGNIDDGQISYSSTGINGFEITIFIYTYELKCCVFLGYQGKDIFNTSLLNVSKISRKGHLLQFDSKDKKLAEIFFSDDFRITTY